MKNILYYAPEGIKEIITTHEFNELDKVALSEMIQKIAIDWLCLWMMANSQDS
jgi:hypothetical protein